MNYVHLLLSAIITLLIVGSCGKKASKSDAQSEDPPELISLSPASSFVNPIPTTLIATFSKAMSPLTPVDFKLEGTCAATPTVVSVSMSEDMTVATATLTGAICNDGEQLTLTINPQELMSSDGVFGISSAATHTYTVTMSGPSVGLETPSSVALNAAGTSTIAFTFTPSAAGGTSLTGSLTEDGAGVTLSTISGSPSCSIALSSLSSSGGTLTISNCIGDGSFTVHVDAGAVEDSNTTPSTVSSESAVITVDNTAPTLTTITPGTSSVGRIPTSITASFSEPMAVLSAEHFTLSGTCSSLPEISSIIMSSDKVTATAQIRNGNCSDGQNLILTMDPTATRDLAGNAGIGSAVTKTYTVSTAGPSLSLSTPSSTVLNAAASAVVTVTINDSLFGGTSLSGTLTASGGGVTLTTLSGTPTCTVGVSGISTRGATITLSNCSGNGTLSLHVNAGIVADSQGTLNQVSDESATITIDNTAPTLSSTSPSSGGLMYAVPTSISLTFSEAVTATASNFSVSTSTCSTKPTISSISGSGTSVIVVSLSGGSCSVNQTVVLTATLSAITDRAGNPGVSSTSVTLTYSVRKIFVTTSTYDGNLGGVSGADAKCAADAAKPSDGATYKAMLAQTGVRVACTTSNCSGGVGEHTDWVLEANTTYYRSDSSTVIGTTTSAGIFSFPLTNKFGTDNVFAWTGVLSGWTSSLYQCNNWTSTIWSVEGAIGAPNLDTSNTSIYNATNGCHSSNTLYCVQQ